MQTYRWGGRGGEGGRVLPPPQPIPTHHPIPPHPTIPTPAQPSPAQPSHFLRHSRSLSPSLSCARALALVRDGARLRPRRPAVPWTSLTVAATTSVGGAGSPSSACTTSRIAAGGRQRRQGQIFCAYLCTNIYIYIYIFI